jgi:PAS domain S-box-containing protein
MLDPQGHVATWNPGAERLKGYSEAEILGTHFSKFFPPEDVASGKPEQELEVARSQGRFEVEGWRVRKDGSRFWANIVISRMLDADGRLLGFVKVTRDLTERRKLEQERLSLAHANEAIRLRDEFLSVASHELKTPLTALQLQLQSIHDRVRENELVVPRVERAMRSGERLAQLVETLLDVSRIATGHLTLQLETFELTEATREVVERLRDGATRAGCELTLAVDGPIIGQWDRLRLEQILMNLLANSFKYAAGRPVLVSTSRIGEEAVIAVQDQGPGIPEGELSRVFERFERATSARQFGGLGLGLYVARQIAVAHGGTIDTHNVPGGGACFTVRLPISQSSPPK